MMQELSPLLMYAQYVNPANDRYHDDTQAKSPRNVHLRPPIDTHTVAHQAEMRRTRVNNEAGRFDAHTSPREATTRAQTVAHT